MDNTIQQTNKFKSVTNAIFVIFGTIIVLSISIAIPTLLRKPIYDALLGNGTEAIKTVSGVFTGITLAFFAVVTYVSWRIFAKRSFIAWLGATLLMTMLILLVFFAI